MKVEERGRTSAVKVQKIQYDLRERKKEISLREIESEENHLSYGIQCEADILHM